MAVLSVVLDSGSRYEVNYPSGITHFLQKLAFGVSAFALIHDLVYFKTSFCECVNVHNCKPAKITTHLF